MIKRKRGLVVHVSSESALQPIPLLSLYRASKAFVNFFSKALQHEYMNARIQNQVLTPSFISTNLSKMRARGVMVPSADCFTQMAVNAFGLSSVMSGWWAHELQSFLISIIPEVIFYRIVKKTMHSGRNRWLRKQQQKTE